MRQIPLSQCLLLDDWDKRLGVACLPCFCIFPNRHAPCVGSAKPNVEYPVYVTSYEIVMADVKFLARTIWKYLVVDEGHRLKNFNCRLLRELRTLPVLNKLLLSGEPGY